jgi:hypothetical protein
MPRLQGAQEKQAHLAQAEKLKDTAQKQRAG